MAWELLYIYYRKNYVKFLLFIKIHSKWGIYIIIEGKSLEEKAYKLIDKLSELNLIKCNRNKKERVSLSEAKIVVSGGRGVDGPDGFKLLNELAELLGGEIGASRVAVDSGWIDSSRWIGQSKHIVKPDVYFACGISGSIQHQAGMLGKYIVAINKDIYAPIFNICHFGIVGDLYEVIPYMIKAIKERC